jgi:hypothetical protein
MKVVFPLLWISAFGLATLALWLASFHDKTGAAVTNHLKWIFLAAWVTGTTFILWTCTGLKQVRMDSENLYVSNYLKEITIPFRMIADVTENRWVNIHPVTIYFRGDTEFGSQITFMPTSRLALSWSSHPVVAELKQKAGLS